METVEGIFGISLRKKKSDVIAAPQAEGETCRRKQHRLLLCLVDPDGGWGDPTRNKAAERSDLFTTNVLLLSRKKLNESIVRLVMVHLCDTRSGVLHSRLVMVHLCDTHSGVLCSSLRSYSQSLR